jgi:hypothetical protein
VAGITVTCYGACGGVAGWRDPVTKLPCSLCGGAGEFTTYDQRARAAHEWDEHRAKQVAKAKKIPKDKNRHSRAKWRAF